MEEERATKWSQTKGDRDRTKNQKPKTNESKWKHLRTTTAKTKVQICGVAYDYFHCSSTNENDAILSSLLMAAAGVAVGFVGSYFRPIWIEPFNDQATHKMNVTTRKVFAFFFFFIFSSSFLLSCGFLFHRPNVNRLLLCFSCFAFWSNVMSEGKMILVRVIDSSFDPKSKFLNRFFVSFAHFLLQFTWHITKLKRN